jgi:hypothetical protein
MARGLVGEAVIPVLFRLYITAISGWKVNHRVVLPPWSRIAVGLQNLHETVEDMGIDALTTALESSAGVPTRTGYSLMRSMWKVPALVEEAIEHSGTAQQARLGVGRLYTQDW